MARARRHKSERRHRGSLARSLAGYVLTSLYDPGWVVRIVSILRGIPVNKPSPHQDPPEVGTVTTT